MAISTKEKIKTIIRLIREPKVFSALISLRHSGFLKDVGWFASFNQRKPVDRSNNPIPWFTYSSIDFLSKRVHKGLTVFEFGSGNSTLFFAKRVKEVTSAEHNIEWYNKLKSKIPGNSNLILSKSDGSEDYLAVLKRLNKKFDLIIIDGIHRVDCCLSVSNYLSDKGVIILDDSEREQYFEGIENLTNEGFKRIDFWGISAGYLYKKDTTVFYKTQNCLGI